MITRLIVTLLTGLLLAACSASQPATVTPQQVIDAFKTAGLEAENPAQLTKEEGQIAPHLTDNAVRFLIPSLGPDTGGRVFVFENEEDLRIMTAYYEKLGESTDVFKSWLFTNGLVLVQIPATMPEETAKKYEAALGGL